MRMFQKGLPVKLGKSPNEKTKPVITIHKKYPNNEATKGQQPKTNQALEPQVPNAQLPTPSLPPVISTCRSRMYLPYLALISHNLPISRATSLPKFPTRLYTPYPPPTYKHYHPRHHHSPRGKSGRVGPPPPKGEATTSNPTTQQKTRSLPTHLHPSIHRTPFTLSNYIEVSRF